MNIRLNQWGELKNMLQKRFSQLSEEDLKFERGKEAELLKRLERKTGRSQEEVSRIIRSFLKAYQQQHLL